MSACVRNYWDLTFRSFQIDWCLSAELTMQIKRIIYTPVKNFGMIPVHTTCLGWINFERIRRLTEHRPSLFISSLDLAPLHSRYWFIACWDQERSPQHRRCTCLLYRWRSKDIATGNLARCQGVVVLLSSQALKGTRRQSGLIEMRLSFSFLLKSSRLNTNMEGIVLSSWTILSHAFCNI